MFSRLYGSDSRACDKIVETSLMPSTIKADLLPQLPPKDRPVKRRRSSIDDIAVPTVITPIPPPSKRFRLESNGKGPCNGVATTVPVEFKGQIRDESACHGQVNRDLDAVKEVIEVELSMEILIKHNELRFINQEMAKCQIALEQLRRAHLMPYPTTCPTPQQMLDIASGKGACVRPRPGEAVPKWGAPFGVVDGPYTRHYAKWLIPDPVFDGVRQDMQSAPQVVQSRNATEGRTTRNSFADPSTIKPRSGRGSGAQKLHALPSGYAQPKEKAGPCIVKRSDGRTVKLECIDCNRWDFSSTQGFINHCRIAHKRDYKSHEEAANACGHPIEVDDVAVRPIAEQRLQAPIAAATAVPTQAPSTATGLVHPLARSDKEAANILLARVKSVMQGLKKSNTSTASGRRKMSTTTGVRKNSTKLVPSLRAPYLSKLMQNKKAGGNLKQHVEDATAQDILMSDEDEYEDKSPSEPVEKPTFKSDVGGVRTPAVSRVPVAPPPALATGMRPLSSKGRSPHLSFATPIVSPPLGIVGKHEASAELYGDVDMDTELSPNTATSNNAPSLVSDDGEYDDSEGSTTENSDSETESVSDVAEITIEEDEPGAPRAARYHRGSTGAAAVKLKEKDNKHVTFVSPVRTNGKARRNQNV